MKQYIVKNNKTGYREEFYSLPEAKKAMINNEAKGYILKIYSNGDYVDCGEINLNGNNKTFVAGTKQLTANYN